MFDNLGELIRVLIPVAFGLLGAGLYFFILRPRLGSRSVRLMAGSILVLAAVGLGYLTMSFFFKDMCCTIAPDEEQEFVIRPPIDETQYPILAGDFESREEIEPTVEAIEAALLNRDEDMVFCTRIEEGISFGNIYLSQDKIRFSGGNLGLATEQNMNGLLTADKIWLWASGDSPTNVTMDQLNKAQYGIARENILSDLDAIDFRCGVQLYSAHYFELNDDSFESRRE